VADRLQSDDPFVRRWAARVLTNMGAKTAAPAREAIAQALAREKNEDTLWYVVQAVDELRPDPKDVVPPLLKVLEHPSVELRRMAADALGHIGPPAASAKPALIRALSRSTDGWLQSTLVSSVRQIGIDAADARALAAAAVPDDSEGARDILRLFLREYPGLAIRFLGDHPRLLAAMPADDLALIDLFARDDAASADLRAFLSRQPDLPKFIRVNYARGERIGRVMTWPRVVDPKLCFPQGATVVRVEAGGRAAIERVANDPHDRLWDAEGLVVLGISDKWGFADAATGRITIEPRFDLAQNFSEGRAVVVTNHKYGFVDKEGKLVVPTMFEWAYAFSHGTSAVQVDGKFGLIDRDGHWIKKPTYERIDPHTDGWWAQTSDHWEGMLDARGELISPVKRLD